jgi:putative oxygen-independent coproporphyrinogen III oxidase
LWLLCASMTSDFGHLGAPDSPALADRAAAWRGAYVHTPFCHRVCPYCDFAVVAGHDDLAGRYRAAVTAEIEAAVPFGGPLDAVYFGGGTPTWLPPGALAAMLEALEARFGLAPGAEVSLEANPEDWTPQLAEVLAGAGFNRVSLGAQSYDPSVLAFLGRCHLPQDVDSAVAVARGAGFSSINIDLIFGTPGESLASWRASVGRALESGIGHLSAYALTVERGTPLSRLVAAGGEAPDPDDQADKYEWLAEAAEGYGMVRYETSNYAIPGQACAYNLLTWAQGEYCGVGAAAHSHRAGIRYWNVRRVDRYLERLDAGKSARSGSEQLGDWARELERLVLGLRRAAGAVAGEAGRRLEASPSGAALLLSGVLERRGERLRVARPLLGDEVARSVLSLEQGDC